MKTQAYRTKLSEIFPIFTPRVLVLPPPPPDMGSQSISCYPSPTLAAFLRVFPIPCLYPFILKAFPHQRTKLELSRQKDKFCQILKPSDSVSV